MKSIIKIVFSALGYRIMRTEGGYILLRKRCVSKPAQEQRSAAVPCTSNFDNIALIMEHFAKALPGAVFVQIGANDGETSDSVNTFVKRGILKSFLVEPIPSTYSKLEKFYKDTPNLVLINAALDHKAGQSIIYNVKDEGRWYGNAWATQLASFDKGHLLRHGITPEEIEQVEIETIDFPTLIKRYNIPRIDVLQIDVEGFDAEIVDMALALPDLPLCICFEFVQFTRVMEQADVDAFYGRLRAKGYRWSHDRINTMAIHDTFVACGDAEPSPVFQGGKA